MSLIGQKSHDSASSKEKVFNLQEQKQKDFELFNSK